MNGDFPEVTVACDAPNCDKELSLLEPHLQVQLRPVVQVLQTEVKPATEGQPMPEHTLYAGTQFGRGVMKRFHDFNCAISWLYKYRDKEPILEPHAEEGDMYVPEDNRLPEELVAAGEMEDPVAEMHATLAQSDAEAKAAAEEGGDQ
jgi:hypothetical protein